MKKNINFRTCIISRKKEHKDNLIRFVITNNQLEIDLNNQLPGRGFYVSKNKEIINKAINDKILEKKLKINVSKDVYDKLAKI